MVSLLGFEIIKETESQMKKPVLIIKTGSTTLPQAKTRGDFEDWILQGMSIDKDNSLIVDVRKGTPLPLYDSVSGIIITGSHDMVTEPSEWRDRTAAWLPGAVRRNIPILGICYGHHILAYSLGGKVDYNPRGKVFETEQIYLCPAAQNDQLFGILPEKVHFQASHAQCIFELPAGARLLASSEKDKNHAFIIGQCAWGIQFHPEFDREIIIAYLKQFKEKLMKEGIDAEKLIVKSSDTPYGPVFLRRFAEIIEEKNSP